MTGSFTLQIRTSVDVAMNGSTNALAGSGTSSMSLSWISWNPRMLDPSKPIPSSKMSALNSLVDTVKCCQRPGRSTNLQVDRLDLLALDELHHV